MIKLEEAPGTWILKLVSEMKGLWVVPKLGIRIMSALGDVSTHS